MCVYVFVCVCMCVCLARLLKTIQSLSNRLNKLYCFSVSYMKHAINTVNGRGHSNDAHYEFLPKPTFATKAFHLVSNVHLLIDESLLILTIAVD